MCFEIISFKKFTKYFVHIILIVFFSCLCSRKNNCVEFMLFFRLFYNHRFFLNNIYELCLRKKLCGFLSHLHFSQTQRFNCSLLWFSRCLLYYVYIRHQLKFSTGFVKLSMVFSCFSMAQLQSSQIQGFNCIFSNCLLWFCRCLS